MNLAMRPRAVGAGIHVGDETYHGQRLVGVGRQCGVQVTVFVEFHIFHAQGLEFRLKMAGKGKLFLRAGCAARIFGRLGVETDVLQESFNDVHIGCFFVNVDKVRECGHPVATKLVKNPLCAPIPGR